MTPEQETLESWQADRRERLAANLLDKRPEEYDRPGQLDPRLAAWAEDLAAGVKRNLIITGQVGTGKTWAIWHAAEHAVRSGYEGRVIITTAARLRRVIAPATADPQEFTRYRNAGLLVIDDIAAVRLSEWDIDHLYEITDERWAEHRPLAVTSNNTDLQSLLGPRICSRLQHHALIVEFNGDDRRRQP